MQNIIFFPPRKKLDLSIGEHADTLLAACEGVSKYVIKFDGYCEVFDLWENAESFIKVTEDLLRVLGKLSVKGFVSELTSTELLMVCQYGTSLSQIGCINLRCETDRLENRYILVMNEFAGLAYDAFSELIKPDLVY